MLLSSLMCIINGGEFYCSKITLVDEFQTHTGNCFTVHTAYQVFHATVLKQYNNTTFYYAANATVHN